MKKNLILSIMSFLGLYILSAGVSYAVFSFVVSPSVLNFVSGEADNQESQQPEDQTPNDLKPLLDVSGEKTEVCPLTGEKYTLAEKNSWETRRPLLVMVENHEDSRPQSGISSADIVYEAVSEGGITRFMGVFYCDAQSHEAIIGPVRSVRTYFIDWASEYGDYPLFAHVGGANCNHGCPWGREQADALGQIDKYGWGGITGNDLNQFSIGYPTFWRDYERLGRTVATEHTMYSTTERLWAIGKTRGWTNVDEEGNSWNEDFIPWKFADKDLEDGATQTISYDFWSDSPAGDYSVSWTYDPTKKVYQRNNSGQPQLDNNTDKQLTTKNLIVSYVKETPANDGYDGGHLLYGTIGKGTGVLFQNGNAEEINWSKASRTARTIFTTKDGNQVEFVPGKIWISIVPTYSESLTY